MKKIMSFALAGLIVMGSAGAANAGYPVNAPERPKGYISGCDWCNYWFKAHGGLGRGLADYYNGWFRK